MAIAAFRDLVTAIRRSSCAWFVGRILKGLLPGFQSIRINNRWGIVFRRNDAGPEQVAIIDCHCRITL